MNRQQRRSKARTERKLAKQHTRNQRDVSDLQVPEGVAHRSGSMPDTAITPAASVKGAPLWLPPDDPQRDYLAGRFAELAQSALQDTNWGLQQFDKEALEPASVRLLHLANRGSRLFIQILADTQPWAWQLAEPRLQLPEGCDLQIDTALRGALEALHQLHQRALFAAAASRGTRLETAFRSAAQSLARTQFALARLLLRIQAAQYAPSTPAKPLLPHTEATPRSSIQTTRSQSVPQTPTIQFSQLPQKEHITPKLNHPVTEYVGSVPAPA
jgi:hypothetical protein